MFLEAPSIPEDADRSDVYGSFYADGNRCRALGNVESVFAIKVGGQESKDIPLRSSYLDASQSHRTFGLRIVVDQRDGTRWFARIIPVRGDEISERLSHLRNELGIHLQLLSPFVLPISHIIEIDQRLLVVYPYVPQAEDLHNYLCSRGRLTVGEAMNIFRDVTQALRYLHELDIALFDGNPCRFLKGEGRTILWSMPYAVRLNFGRGFRGVSGISPQYVAPETAAGEIVDTKADIWSLGCLLYKMLAGDDLIKGQPHAAERQLIATDLESIIGMKIDNLDIPDPVRRVLYSTLVRKATDRVTTKKLMEVFPNHVSNNFAMERLDKCRHDIEMFNSDVDEAKTLPRPRCLMYYAELDSVLDTVAEVVADVLPFEEAWLDRWLASGPLRRGLLRCLSHFLRWSHLKIANNYFHRLVSHPRNEYTGVIQTSILSEIFGISVLKFDAILEESDGFINQSLFTSLLLGTYLIPLDPVAIDHLLGRIGIDYRDFPVRQGIKRMALITGPPAQFFGANRKLIYADELRNATRISAGQIRDLLLWLEPPHAV